MPWYKDHLRARATLSPILVKTNDTLRMFSRDFPATKQFLAIDLSRPELPDSEWDNIIRGRPINLDAILAFSTTGLNSDHRASSKMIQNSSQWITASYLAERALVHIFPHRQTELDQYRRYILRLFNSIVAEETYRVIYFDRLARSYAGARNDILLSDFAAFGHLWIKCFSDCGSLEPSFPRTRTKTQKQRGRKRKLENARLQHLEGATVGASTTTDVVTVENTSHRL